MCSSDLAIGAHPIGAPGCPEFAAWTVSIASVRIAVIADCSSRGSIGNPLHVDRCPLIVDSSRMRCRVTTVARPRADVED